MDERIGDAGRYLYRFGSVEFDSARTELRVDGADVDIEPKPLAVLAILLEHAGEVVTKSELIETLWGGRVISPQVVPNALNKLRRVLGTDNAARIVTVARFGYRLDGPVERIAIGRVHPVGMAMAAGQLLPGRQHWVLQACLGGSEGSEVWRIGHAKTGETRVCKFCTDGERLRALRRELTICRVLQAALGERRDFVRLVDWQLDEAPFFLEFEYGGINILEWAESGDGLTRLGVDARIALFLQIADAVASAHEVGVLHKDLKPSNVLIRDEDGGRLAIRLTDFGSSRLLEPERIEAYGITRLDVAAVQTASRSSDSGTLLYLAPELFERQPPTIRSDVYALGVMLYQLAAGNLRKPLASGWELEIDDELLREDIALATAGDPRRRLASAAELAQRLRDREQRRAAKQSQDADRRRAAIAERRLERERARRPWIVGALLVLLVGVTTSLALYLDASRARDAALLEAQRAQALTDFVVDDIIGSGRIYDQGYEKDPTLREVLVRAEKAVGERFAGKPLIEAGVSVALADALVALDDRESAVALYERARDLYLERLGGTAAKVAIVRYRLAEALSDLRRYEDAAAELAQADAALASSADPESELRIAAASAHSTYYFQQLKVHDALPYFRQLTSLLEQHRPDDVWLAFYAARGIAECLARSGEYTQAAAQYQAILADTRFAPETIGSGSGLIKVSLGSVLRSLGRHDEALPLIASGQAEMEQASGPDDYNAITALGHLAGAHAAMGRHDEALSVYQEVHDRLQRRFGASSAQALAQLINVGISYRNLHRSEEAIEVLQRAESGLSATYDEHEPMVQAARYYLASALGDAGRFDEGMSLLDRVEPGVMQAATGGKAWHDKLSALRGEFLLQQGHLDEGFRLLRTALEGLQDAGVSDELIEHYRAVLLRHAPQSGASS